MVFFDEEKQNKTLDSLRKQEEESLAQMLSDQYGFGYTNFSNVHISSDALKVLPEAVAQKAHIAPFKLTGKKLSIAIKSPSDEYTKQVLADLEEKGYILEIFMVSTVSLEKALAVYKDISQSQVSSVGVLNISDEEIEKLIGKIETLADLKDKLTETLLSNKMFKISRLIERIFAGALAMDASDVHIEPQDTEVKIRFRLNGILTDIITFDHKTYAFLISRIKILSGLKLNVQKDSQDGRFSIKIQGTDVEIRTSTLPEAYGESVVMRILNPKSINVPIESLGMHPDMYALLEKEIQRPNGMILNTGPTGSGKTTTLYACLKKVSSPDIKIITIEDPIEYHLKGVVQTQTNLEKGYTFSQGLRAAVRQDPDVIMIGEIRDPETASIAIQSALTGHLVFSTLHTNSAAGAFTRLADLQVDPKILSSAINLSMAQRLVRILCPSCKKESVLGEEDSVSVFEILDRIKDKKYITNTKKVWEAGEGCKTCHGTGYKGRIGIYELILNDEAVGNILRDGGPDDRKIQKAAEDSGLFDMKADGVLKMFDGITSIQELKRVVDI
jgi:type II secretory ATPase GspE/PulE/Tfp pilus assembly ATPase PilB-like protein